MRIGISVVNEGVNTMVDKQCPKDVGLTNTFSGEDCEREQFYNNCYHCWSTARAKGNKKHKGVLEQLAEEQDSLIATVRAWDATIKKHGYVN